MRHSKLVEGKAVMMITLRLRTGVNSDQIIVLKMANWPSWDHMRN